MKGLAQEEAEKILPMFSFQQPECETSASASRLLISMAQCAEGTTSVSVKYMGDAGPISGTDDTQTAGTA